MLYEDLTRKIIGCAMKVHSSLGSGFQEVVYQRALGIELAKLGIEYMREYEMDLYYNDQVIGTRRVDFYIENKIMVELKSITNLEDVHLAQALNYLEAYHVSLGLLINFGSRSLEFKRIHNNKLSKNIK